MCPIADIYELSDRSQNGKPDTKAPENPVGKNNRTASKNVCLREEPKLEESKTIKEIEQSSLAKITILHIKKESLIVETEEDPRKPWYFAHV